MNSLSPLLNTIGWTRGITETRQQMIDLQRQLGSGQIAETHGELGSGRALALSMQTQIARTQSYQQTIDVLQVRLDLTMLSVDRFGALMSQARSDVLAQEDIEAGANRTLASDLARNHFDEAVALLNADVGGRFAFSGRAVDTRPTEAANVILRGDATRAGLDTLIAERKLADAGADGRGRLSLSNGGTNLTVSEDGAHDFGFKLVSIETSIAGASLTQPGGTAPQSVDIALAGQPAAGDTVTVSVDLPDGSREQITLTASDTIGEPGTFAIAASVTDTVANLEAALGAALESRAGEKLDPASAIQTARDFFAADLNNPPQRIDGPPFETATGTVAATDADTVIWYRGENDGGDARATSTARLDDNLVVGYGTRANEEPFAWGLAHMAVFALEEFNHGDPADDARYAALKSKVGDGLAYTGGVRSVGSMQAEFASIHAAYGAARERHTLTLNLAQQSLADVTKANNEEVAVKLLQLQTQLQASYEATALISQLSLARFL